MESRDLLVVGEPAGALDLTPYHELVLDQDRHSNSVAGDNLQTRGGSSH
jgi:hypothetical protein